MKTVGQIIDSVAGIVAVRSSQVERDVILKYMQESYYELARKTSWTSLRKTFDLNFSDGTTERWLPSDMIGIDAVLGGVTTGYREYMARDESDVDYDETTYRYFFSDVARTPVAEGDDLLIIRDATTFTAATLTTDYTNDFIMFGSFPALYKLTAQTTIDQTYRGEPITDGHWQVRPPGTKKISAVTPSRIDTTENLVCYYWSYPPPLFRESDVILIPAYRVLELMTAIKYIGDRHKKDFKANSFRDELLGQNRSGEDGAMAQAIKQNPDFSPPTIPKDLQGNKFDISRNTFARRTGVRNNQIPGSDPWRGYFNR